MHCAWSLCRNQLKVPAGGLGCANHGLLGRLGLSSGGLLCVARRACGDVRACYVATYEVRAVRVRTAGKLRDQTTAI